MKDFTSKLSLYDILTQLISGFLILALFIPMPANGRETVTESYHWIFLLIFSYSIGIIYHRLLEWIRSKENLEVILIFFFIICLLLLLFQDIGCVQIGSCLQIIFYVVIFIISCWLFFGLDKIKTIFQRNYFEAIKNAREIVYKDKKTKNIPRCSLEQDYYKIYYSIMEKPAYSTISILETQEAFLRNITWIVVAYLLCYYFSLFDEQKLFECIFILEPPSMLSSNCLILCVSLLLFLILILFARYQTQMKVYKAVWEAGKYVQNSSETEGIIDIKK